MKRSILLAGALVLSACSSIPSSGPIVQGQRVDVVRNDGYVRVIARPPVDGMTPDALVRGFLEASASVADGDETARLYLTPTASSGWNPQKLIVVYDAAALSVTADRGDAVKITAPKIGSIDARHRYSAADAGSTVVDELQLKQIDGQWRIDSAPQALYLGEGDVMRSFRAHPVFFFDPKFERLVPEFVLLPVGGSPATQLVRTLLSGPSSVYGNALATAIPRGTTLSYRMVSLDGVTATVALDRNVLNTTPVERDALVAQIVWTLSTLSDVVLVRVTVEGEPLVVPSGRTSHSAGDYLQFDPEDAPDISRLIYVRGSRVLSLSEGERSIISDGSPMSSATVSRDESMQAVILKDRTLLYVGKRGSTLRPVAAGRDLARPQFMPDGTLWFVDREAKGGLRTWDATAGVLKVITGLPEAARILDYAIAPDHTRIAMVVNDGATTTLRVGVIQHEAAGARVLGLSRVEGRLTALSAVAWESMSDLVVLGSAGAVAVQPIRVGLPAGAITLLGGPANATSLSAGLDMPIVVGDQAGQLWEYRDNRWQASVLGSSPNYVG